MYKAYCGDAILHNVKFNKYVLQNPIVNQEVNTSGTFSFTIYPEHPNYEAIKRMNAEHPTTVEKDGEVIFKGRVLEEKLGMYKEKTVMCEGELGYFNDSIIEPYEFAGTVQRFLEKIINEHNSQVDRAKQFKLGNCEFFGQEILRDDANYNTAWAEIKTRLIDEVGGYINLRYEDDGTYVDYLEEFKEEINQTVRLGSNVMELQTARPGVDIATVLLPLGHTETISESVTDQEGNTETITTTKTVKIDELEDKDITDDIYKKGSKIYSNNGINKHRNICKVVKWEDILTPETLLEKAVKKLEEITDPLSNIDVKVIDLSMVEEVDAIKVGVMIPAYLPEHGINKKMLCTKMSHYLASPQNNMVSLGSAFKELTASTANSASNLNDLGAKIVSINTKAEEAKKDSTNANGKAEEAQTTAGNANTVAKDAKGKAEEAKEEAKTANKKAEEAQTTAENAIIGAETASGKADEVQITADGKNTIYHQGSKPMGGIYKINDLWFDTAKGNKISTWDGTDWVENKLDHEALNIGKLSAISADLGDVTAGTITGVKINAVDAMLQNCNITGTNTVNGGFAFSPPAGMTTEINNNGLRVNTGGDGQAAQLSLSGQRATVRGYTGLDLTCRGNVNVSSDVGAVLINGQEPSLEGHSHSRLYNNIAPGQNIGLFKSGVGYYLYGSDTAVDTYLGGNNHRFRTCYLKVAPNVSSDMRLKSNYNANMDKYIAMLDLIEPLSYERIDETGKRHVGYLAQKVLKAMHDVGLKREEFSGVQMDMQADGNVYTYSLAYEEFIPVLHAKIKQIETENTGLKAQVDLLEERLVTLEVMAKKG